MRVLRSPRPSECSMGGCVLSPTRLGSAVSEYPVPVLVLPPSLVGRTGREKRVLAQKERSRRPMRRRCSEICAPRRAGSSAWLPRALGAAADVFCVLAWTALYCLMRKMRLALRNQQLLMSRLSGTASAAALRRGRARRWATGLVRAVAAAGPPLLLMARRARWTAMSAA